MYLKRLAKFVTLALIAPPCFAQVAAKCVRPDGGSFVWGQSPVGCDAQALGDVHRAERLYRKLIFDRRKADSHSQMMSYMTAMSATLKKMAADYIRRRQPHVSQAEVKVFALAIEAVATQESLWTHYRIGLDGRLKLMTGDHNQSLGMMQLHESANSAKGRSRFDLARNILMGIEHYYMNWVEASHASCVHSLTEKARAAYSAYNGGPASVCRWQDSSSTWYRNDLGYYQKYSRRPWLQYVSNRTAKPPVDLQCALSGASDCAHTEYNSSTPVDLNRKIVQLKSGKQCFSVNGKTMYCAPDLRTFSCLDAFDPGLAKQPVVKIDDHHPALRAFEIKNYDNRDALCEKAIADLALPGEFVETNGKLPLLDTPTGKKIGEAQPNEIYQVIDYDVNGVDANLKYRVMTPSGPAWIKAGDTGHRVVEKINSLNGRDPIARLLPVVGDKIQVTHKGGVNLHSNPSADARVIDVVPADTELRVLAVYSKGGMGERYLKVEGHKFKGWIYSGATAPEPDVNQWVKIEGLKFSSTSPSSAAATTPNDVVPLPKPRPTIKADGKMITLILKGGANLRSGPSVDEKVVASIPEGARLRDLGPVKGPNANERWIQVEWNGKKGALYVGLTDSDVKQRIKR